MKIRALTTSLLMLTTPLLFSIAHSATYSVTIGAFDGTRHAAGVAVREIMSERSCRDLNADRLTALMLSIPVHEVAGGDTGIAVSPMTLSRWDTWSLRADNRNLYSHATYSDYKRAHWNPGIGMWQLDTWEDTLHLNHGQRINTSTGGLFVARYLGKEYCKGDSAIQNALNNTWYACRWGKCWDTYRDIYNNGSLNVNKQGGWQWDGGVSKHKCRWGTSNSTFTCYWVNTDLAEGWMDTSDPTGAASRTPLAIGFLSFHAGSKRAAWLRSSGFDKSIVKWVPNSDNARDAKNWYDNTSLQVYKCVNSCWWSSWGLSL